MPSLLVCHYACPVIVLFVDIFLNCVLDAFNNLETKLAFLSFPKQVIYFSETRFRLCSESQINEYI